MTREGFARIEKICTSSDWIRDLPGGTNITGNVKPPPCCCNFGGDGFIDGEATDAADNAGEALDVGRGALYRKLVGEGPVMSTPTNSRNRGTQDRIHRNMKKMALKPGATICPQIGQIQI